MYISREEIDAMDRVDRLKLINSITGIKPANLIGTTGENGRTNLALFSSVIHLGSNPPTIGIVSRPDTDVDRHTLRNIRETKVFTINSVDRSFYPSAHQTSASYDDSVSEFDVCGIEPEYVEGFDAPFAKPSAVKIGLKLNQEVPLPNGTVLVIGEVAHLMSPDLDAGSVNLDSANVVGIGGVDAYYSLSLLDRLAYTRTKP